MGLGWHSKFSVSPTGPSQPSPMLTLAGPPTALASLVSCLPSAWGDLPRPDLPGECLPVLYDSAQVRSCLSVFPATGDLTSNTKYLLHPAPHSLSSVHFLEGVHPWALEENTCSINI